jgi:hypothetical protein
MKHLVDNLEFTRLLWLSGHLPGLSADLVARRYLNVKVAPFRTVQWVITMFKVWDSEAAKVLVPFELSSPE